MNLLNYFKTFIVFFVLIVPGLVFVFTGPIKGFEQKQQIDFPNTSSIWLPAPKYREQFADAIFERSAAKRWSIQFMNALHLYGFGFIDTKSAISGSDQWLFYKPQFQAWGCDHHQLLQEKLNRFSLLVDLVSASEAPLVFALAPNKASIERDYLGGRTARYLDCYFGFERKFADRVSGMSPLHVVDHSAVLRHPPEDEPTYLKYDTHWSRASGLKALNQLFESWPGVLGIPLYDPETKEMPSIMGILNKILLLEHEEQIEAPVPVKPVSEELQAASLAPNVLILHDSFYYMITQYLVARSPNARLYHLGTGIGNDAREKLTQADIVVAEIAQRHFLDTVWSSRKLGWGGTFAEWLLEELAASSQQCHWEGAKDLLTDEVNQRAIMQNVAIRTELLSMKGSKNSRVLFQIPNDLTSGRVCLRIILDIANSGKAKLFFSENDTTQQQAAYSEALMIAKNLTKGQNILALVLPDSYRGKWIRLDPIDYDGEFTIKSLEVASFDQATLPIVE
jgi:hypothetical protein